MDTALLLRDLSEICAAMQPPRVPEAVTHCVRALGIWRAAKPSRGTAQRVMRQLMALAELYARMARGRFRNGCCRNGRFRNRATVSVERSVFVVWAHESRLSFSRRLQTVFVPKSLYSLYYNVFISGTSRRPLSVTTRPPSRP